MKKSPAAMSGIFLFSVRNTSIYIQLLSLWIISNNYKIASDSQRLNTLPREERHVHACRKCLENALIQDERFGCNDLNKIKEALYQNLTLRLNV